MTIFTFFSTLYSLLGYDAYNILSTVSNELLLYKVLERCLPQTNPQSSLYLQASP